MLRLQMLLACLLMSMSMAIWAKPNPEKQLQSNLAQWEQFRWQGMVQVMHEAFTVRKFYVLSKNTEALRLDVLDSGVMGLSARPMLAIYVKDRIVLDAPAVKELQGIDLNWYVTPDKFKPFFTMSSTLLSHSDVIVTNRKLNINGMSYAFDKQYRLASFTAPELQLALQITYNRKNEPDKLSLYYQNTLTAVFTIDERTAGPIEITPLQAPDAGLNDGTVPSGQESPELYSDPE